MAAGVGFQHCLTVFEMIFYAAKLEIDMLLQFFGKGRKGLILQAVQNMPPQICIGQIFPCGYKIQLYGIVVTPQNLFQCAALRPVQTPDSEMFREDIVYIKFQAYLILLLKNWETGMKARCRFMSHSLKKYPRLKEISEVKRFTKLIHLYSFSSILGKLYMKYYIRKGKIRI